jgi:hypothetical protein
LALDSADGFAAIGNSAAFSAEREGEGLFRINTLIASAPWLAWCHDINSRDVLACMWIPSYRQSDRARELA